MTEQEKRIRKYRLRINMMGMIDYDLVDEFWLQDLIYKHFIFDDVFAKAVDEVTGSRIFEKKTQDEKIEQINMLLSNTARCLIVVNLVFKYLSHLADEGANRLLDIYWKDRLGRFSGFKKQGE